MKPLALTALLQLLFLVGCSPYLSGYYYLPHPALVNVSPMPATQPALAASQPDQIPAQVLVTIVGVREADAKNSFPLSMEVRLRIDNTGSGPVSFDMRSMDLDTGNLVAFAPPLASPVEQVRLEPGQSGVITAEFPFPNGMTYNQFDVSMLHLHWTLRVGDRVVQQVQDFHRGYYPDYGYSYDPYWDPYPYPSYEPYPYIGGVVIVHRRW